MRDIRADLQERLGSITGRYADEMVSYDEKREALETAHKDTIARLDRERAAVQQLLAFENERDGSVVSSTRPDLVPLGDFIITKLHTHGPLEKDELRSEASAAGYFADGNGRTFHTTLLNLARHGKVTKRSDNRFEFPAKSVGLFESRSTEGEDMPTIM